MAPIRFMAIAAVLICALLGVLERCLAEEVSPADAAPRSRDDFHLYLLLGQSNMAGRGKMAPADKTPAAGVLAMDAAKQWRPGAHPLHFDKPSMVGVGLGIDFAKSMRAADEQATIGLIPCAFGGTKLDQWAKGSKLYNETVARATAGAAEGVLRGILWHQGEGDSTAELAPTYAARLTALIGDLRHDLDAPELPVVVGELGNFRQEKNAFTVEINRQLALVATEVPHVALASAAELRDLGDQTHFDAESLREFGRRYAVRMKQLHKVQ